MKLATRMWLLGAALPAAGTALAIFAGGWLFRANLEHDVDLALAAQASAERVSLFDGPDGVPHVHGDPRSLGEGLRITTGVTVYAADGHPIAHFPESEPWPTARVPPAPPDDPMRFETRGPEGAHERVVRVTAARGADRFTLEVVATLAHVDAAVRAFYEVTLGIALALTALLAVVHTLHARRLATRVARLAAHLRALREGALDADLPADPTRDEIGQLTAVVGEATERLRAARAAQERLIADAAHELRTPLTLMRTSVDVALRRRRCARDGGPQQAECASVLLDVRDEVDRVASLATRLLDLAAAGQGAWDRAPGDLSEVAREAVEGACADAEARGVLIRLDAPGPVPASFHAASVRQAIDNLLCNAVKFSPRGGTVDVRVTALPGGGGAVAVRDEGPGIPEADREVVFEPFRSGSPSKGGAGLGLAIVREIASRHGGRAWVAPPEGKGAEVILELPGRQQEPPARAAAR